MKKFLSITYSLVCLSLLISSCGGSGSATGTSGGTNNASGAGIGTGSSGTTSGGSSFSGNTGGGDNGGGSTPDLGNGSDSNPGNNGGGSGSNDSPVSLAPADSGLDYNFLDTTTDSSGNKSIVLNVSNTTSFQAITGSLGQSIFSKLKDANSNLLVYALNPPSSYAPFSTINVSSLSFPVDPSATAVADGNYILETHMGNNTGFSTIVLAKNDSDLSSGSVDVNIFIVGALAQSYRSQIHQAADTFTSIFNSAGLSPNIRFADLDNGTGIIPNPSSGSSFYYDNSSSLAINIYVGINVSADSSTGGGNTLNVLGIVHSIPGPFIRTAASAVAISLEQHYGVDSVFSAPELTVLGETMAHESGHYLGLFHPVEFANDTHTSYIAGDRLTDTGECNTTTECVSTGLASNLMFPAPVIGVLTQQNLSTQQKKLLNLATIVQ